MEETADAPKPEPGFELLPIADGNIIQYGDRFWSLWLNRWMPTTCLGSQNTGFLIYERRMNTDTKHILELEKRLEAAERVKYETRMALWAGHGHHGIYGDDGEAQCSECSPARDFKRESLPSLARFIANSCVDLRCKLSQAKEDAEFYRQSSLRWEKANASLKRAMCLIKDLARETVDITPSE